MSTTNSALRLIAKNPALGAVGAVVPLFQVGKAVVDSGYPQKGAAAVADFIGGLFVKDAPPAPDTALRAEIADLRAKFERNTALVSTTTQVSSAAAAAPAPAPTATAADAAKTTTASAATPAAKTAAATAQTTTVAGPPPAPTAMPEGKKADDGKWAWFASNPPDFFRMKNTSGVEEDFQTGRWEWLRNPWNPAQSKSTVYSYERGVQRGEADAKAGRENAWRRGVNAESRAAAQTIDKMKLRYQSNLDAMKTKLAKETDARKIGILNQRISDMTAHQNAAGQLQTMLLNNPAAAAAAPQILQLAAQAPEQLPVMIAQLAPQLALQAQPGAAPWGTTVVQQQPPTMLVPTPAQAILTQPAATELVVQPTATMTPAQAILTQPAATQLVVQPTATTVQPANVTVNQMTDNDTGDQQNDTDDDTAPLGDDDISDILSQYGGESEMDMQGVERGIDAGFMTMGYEWATSTGFAADGLCWDCLKE